MWCSNKFRPSNVNEINNNEILVAFADDNNEILVVFTNGDE